MILCPPGALLSQQYVVYNAAQVKWYHSQNGSLTELDTTSGGRYTVNQTSVPSSSRFENCTGDDWQHYQLSFDYSESDSGSYWCQILSAGNIQLELSKP